MTGQGKREKVIVDPSNMGRDYKELRCVAEKKAFDEKGIRCLANSEKKGKRGIADDGMDPSPQARSVTRNPAAGQGKVNRIGGIYDKENGERHQAGSVYDPRGISPLLDTAGGGHREPLITIDKEYSVYDDYHSRVKDDGIIPTVRPTNSRSAPRNASKIIESREKAFGMKNANAVTPDAYLATGKRKRVDGKAVLTSMHERRIRRLTPVECERLQGFPDNWTRTGREKDGGDEEISDTQRYKMMGNAVTVNVIEDIVESWMEEIGG